MVTAIALATSFGAVVENSVFLPPETDLNSYLKISISSPLAT